MYAITMNFREKVLSIVTKIPKGEVLTYGEVARRAGNFKAARAVGAILRTNFSPSIPCHRVTCAHGMLGGYNRGAREKFRLLKEEGALS